MGAMRELNSTNPGGTADKLFGKAITEKAKNTNKYRILLSAAGEGGAAKYFQRQQKKSTNPLSHISF